MAVRSGLVFTLMAGVCTLLHPASPAQAEGGVAAVCAFDALDVRFEDQPLSTDSTTTTISFEGKAVLCLPTGASTGKINASATANPLVPVGFTCLAGVAQGDGSIQVGEGSIQVAVTVVNTAGVFTVVVVSLDDALLGVGSFTQLPTALAECALGELRETTWIGALVVGAAPPIE